MKKVLNKLPEYMDIGTNNQYKHSILSAVFDDSRVEAISNLGLSKRIIKEILKDITKNAHVLQIGLTFGNEIAAVYERHESSYYEFTRKEFIWHRDDGTTWPSSFYLSNTIPEKFDSTKVGVSTSGCYFNKYINKDHFTCYAILSFDKSKGEMVLELKNEKFIGPDDPVTFILIKK